MIKQEHIDINLIKSEPIDGEYSTRDIVSEFLGTSVPTSSTNNDPEPMDQDLPTANTHQPTVVQQTTANATSWTTTSLPATRPVTTFQTVKPVNPIGISTKVASTGTASIPHVNTATGTVRTVQLQPTNNQVSKAIPIQQSTTPTANKQIYIASSNSPSKLIAIQGNSVPGIVQGLRPTALSPQLQLVSGGIKVGCQTTLRPIAPRFTTSTATGPRPRAPGAQIQIITPTSRDGTQVPVNTSQSTTNTIQQARVLIQAVPTGHGASQLRAIAPNISGLPAGAAIQFPVGTIIKDGVVYVPQPVQQGATSTGGLQLSTVQITPSTVNMTNQQQVNGVQESLSPTRIRKPCNCTKSQCLKLYCDCFANGEFCSNCNCNNCSNNIEHENERSKAIKACLERNPHAFHPKIGKGKGETDRRHNKGCHCKRSGCLKNYCECYEAKILCTKLCKCTGCKNFEESPERKTLMHLADAAEVRVQQQNAAKTKLESQMEDLPSRAPILAHAGEKLPFSFVTRDVVEATCRCLLLQAAESERNNKSRAETQKLILEEFGSCLLKIIHTANKRTAC